MIAIVGVVGIAAIAAREYLQKVQEERVALGPIEDGDDDEMPTSTSGAAREEDVDGASGLGPRASGSGSTPDAPSRTPDATSRTPDAASRTPDAESRRPGGRTPETNHAQTTVAAMTQPQLVRAVRKVTINSQPWSNFTIDSDPAQHQTIETVSLPPGPHVIHFVNPELHLEATATVDVPADRDIRFVEPLR
jgi:hypothetical protein